jgi:transcriptional regulator with XRE-family HTH domain
MVDRINLLLKAKNKSSRQFAEEIGIQPSGMSHILSGRNNPSLDFVMKVVKRWPEININWLMFGKGEMYVSSNGTQPVPEASKKEQVVSGVAAQGEKQFDLFSQPGDYSNNGDAVVSESTLVSGKVEDAHVAQNVDNLLPREELSFNSMPSQDVNNKATIPPQGATTQPNENSMNEVAQKSDSVQPSLNKKIVKLIVLYDDHTFSEYYPE